MSATVVDQVARQQQHIGVYFGVVVYLLEALVEVVVVAFAFDDCGRHASVEQGFVGLGSDSSYVEIAARRRPHARRRVYRSRG